MAKKGNRFKDIPVDISTKILRSNLREWGTKVNYGSNLPRNRKQASKSIIVGNDKQLIWFEILCRCKTIDINIYLYNKNKVRKQKIISFAYFFEGWIFISVKKEYDF